MRLQWFCVLVFLTSTPLCILADWSDFQNNFFDKFRQGLKSLEEGLKRLPSTIEEAYKDFQPEKLESSFESAVDSAKKHASKAKDGLKEMLSDGPFRQIEPVVFVDTPGIHTEVDSFESPMIDNFFGSPNIFRIFGPRKEWWRGPNVCVTRKEVDEDATEDSIGAFMTFQSTSCHEMNSSYVCTTKLRSHGINKSFTVIYQCCHGFYRKEGAFGCKEMNLKGLLETIEELGGNEFLKLITATGMEDKLRKENITVFCPTNEAIAKFRDDGEENSVTGRLVRRNTDLAETAHCHLLSGFVRGSEFVDEGILYSEDRQCPIRMNVYHSPEKIVTANCAKIVSIDNHATNGVVHMIDRVLPQATRSIGDIINSDRQFTIFKTLLGKTDLLDKLKEEGQYTVFAPTDDAFRRMDPIKLRQLLNGESCVESMMKYHILPNVICSNIIQSKARSITMLNNDIHLRRDDDNKLFVNDIQIVQRDQITTNGIMNIIENVLIPEESNSITGILDDNQLTDLVSLLDAANMRNEIDNMKNVTFFAPTNEAVLDAKPLLNELRKSPGKLRDVLMFHIAFPSITLCHVDNNQLLNTGLNEKSLRFNHFVGFPFGMSQTVTVQCARIVERDRKACGATVQLVDRVLLPPEGDLLDVLSSNQSFSVARKLLRTSELENELNEGPYTILAPTDDAFYHLPEEQLNQLLNNKEQAAEVMKNHILPEVLCCAGIQENYWLFSSSARTLNGGTISMNRDSNGAVKVGGSRVTVCDVMADNGVVHAVNRIISPAYGPTQKRQRRPTKHKDVYTVL